MSPLAARLQIPLSQMAYQRVMAGDWVLLILDVIGASALAAALVIALWRRAARQAQHGKVVKKCFLYSAEWQGPRSA
jgi:hypothetical protein